MGSEAKGRRRVLIAQVLRAKLVALVTPTLVTEEVLGVMLEFEMQEVPVVAVAQLLGLPVLELAR